MSNNQIKSLTVNGTTYDIVDETSGYIKGMTILSYGSSTWQDFITAYNAQKVVYCRASSQSNPASGEQTRLAFMAYVNDADTPTSVEFQYYRSVSTHTESQQGDQVFVYTLTSTGNWSVTTREASVKVAVSGDLTGSYSNGVYTISGDIPDVSGLAPLVSPSFTGTPTAPTPTSGDDSTKIATTAFVQDAMSQAGAGTITEVKTNAGAHTVIDVTSGKAEFNVPTTAAHVGAVPTTRTVNGKALSSDITLSASDVSALPSSTVIPTKTSDLNNDSGYITGSDVPSNETDPTVPSWAKASSKPSYNFSEIGNTPTTISGYGITDALTIGTTATTAAAGNHTHTTSLATDTGTSTVTLASAGKYKLTAGGTSVIFTMPTIPTVSYPVTSVNTKTGDVTLSASDVGAAATSHAHGNITSGGDITATAPTIANGDQIIINDSSASKITNGPTFDGSTTNKYLSPKGTWESLPQGTAYTAGTGLSLSGTEFNHSNSVDKQETQAVYPITVDAQGHIDSYGSAVTIPTKVSDLTNDSGFVTTDEKLAIGNASNNTTYYPILGTTSTAATRQYTSNLSVVNSPNSSGSGYTRLELGNTASSNGARGTIRLNNGQTGYYVDIYGPNSLTKNLAFYLPNITGTNTSGTLALTSDIPSVPSSATSSTTGISVADHSTSSIYGVTSSTTSVTGVKSTTTTASKVTLGTAISVPNVTAAGSGSFTQGSFNGGSFTQGEDSFTPNIPTAIDTTKFSGGSFSSGTFNGGSFSSGTFTAGSLVFAMDTTDTKQLNITFTAPSHGADSFTAATHGADSFTPASLASGFYSAGSAASFTQGVDSFTPATHGTDTHVHTPPTIGTAISVPNVTGATDVTVPVKADSATTVPIKDSSSTTVVTSKTHTVTDNGHTHSLS